MTSVELELPAEEDHGGEEENDEAGGEHGVQVVKGDEEVGTLGLDQVHVTINNKYRTRYHITVQYSCTEMESIFHLVAAPGAVGHAVTHEVRPDTRGEAGAHVATRVGLLDTVE